MYQVWAIQDFVRKLHSTFLGFPSLGRLGNGVDHFLRGVVCLSWDAVYCLKKWVCNDFLLGEGVFDVFLFPYRVLWADWRSLKVYLHGRNLGAGLDQSSSRGRRSSSQNKVDLPVCDLGNHNLRGNGGDILECNS